MKNTKRIIGWVCFGIALAVYLIATCFFGIGFAGAMSGEALGLALLSVIFLIFGSIVYAAGAVISMIGVIVANAKRGEGKFFFAPVITLVLSVLTWVLFLLICVLR